MLRGGVWACGRRGHSKVPPPPPPPAPPPERLPRFKGPAAAALARLARLAARAPSAFSSSGIHRHISIFASVSVVYVTLFADVSAMLALFFVRV